ncbi:Oidioi.mRNA.OKI2018_I69.PAR.g11730.t1.cds [Oikopleura dioica]|uniref:Oidioi.mRNA.OKI2018_I69.PAR.g11730.t1.cds n=1 Tax=Oikopleura dioica TaxID=34765 RepID=A0ABN7S019_OIKDI|nr:Oidioi.mRNA.OKI2018_I69.PAR.g11730.t1.cds [Oikopleura dioica]
MSNGQINKWFMSKRKNMRKAKIETKITLEMLQKNVGSFWPEKKNQEEASKVIEKLILQMQALPPRLSRKKLTVAEKPIRPEISKTIRQDFQALKDDDQSPEKALDICDDFIAETDDQNELPSYTLLSEDEGPEICLPMYYQNAIEFINKQRVYYSSDNTFELLWSLNCQ